MLQKQNKLENGAFI